MPLTDQQRKALPALRAYFRQVFVASSTALSVDQRARQPDPAHLPEDVVAHVTIAPPSSHAHPLLDIGALKTPERVPVYFYALRSDDAEPAPADTHLIFFIHGGGNITGHPADPPFIQLFAKLLRTVASHAGNARKCLLVAPCYRLVTAPENAFPAGLQDIVAAYDYVLDKGYNPSNIVLAGDSAGGNHAIVLTHLALQSGRTSPGGIVAIAPFSIQAFDLMSEYAKAQASNDLIDTSNGDQVVKAYVGDSGLALTDPLISGAFIPFDASWPKTLILVGTCDQLIDSSRELAKRLADIGRPVELVEYDERPHAWWVLEQIFPGDIQDAANRIAHFVLH